MTTQMTAQMTNLYDVLDVDPSATADEIRTAWRAAVADLDPTDRRFRAYNQAAEVLLDPERRAAYDAAAEQDVPTRRSPRERPRARPKQPPSRGPSPPARARRARRLLIIALAAVTAVSARLRRGRPRHAVRCRRPLGHRRRPGGRGARDRADPVLRRARRSTAARRRPPP